MSDPLGSLTERMEVRLDGRVQLWAGDGIGVIVMNRPEKRNALDEAQIEALETALDLAQRSPDIRAIALMGAGRAFCAGGDIEMFLSLDVDTSHGFTRRGHALANRLESGEKPVISAVHGPCVAGGLELALACDFILAAETARFGLTEVNLGLIPGWGGTVRLASAIPLRLARQYLLTCQLIEAERARDLGLVNEVMGEDQLLPRAVELAKAIADKSPSAVLAARRVVNAAAVAGNTGALELEAAWSANLFPGTDVQTRVADWVKGRRS